MLKRTLVAQQLDIQEVIKSTSQTKKKKNDKNGRILILDVKVDETNFVLVKIYNSNTETEQVATLHDFDKMLETIKDLYDKHIVLAGGFNFSFETHPQIHTEANQL